MALQGSSRNNLTPLNNRGNNTLMGLNVMLHASESNLSIENLYGEPVVCISVIDESNSFQSVDNYNNKEGKISGNPNLDTSAKVMEWDWNNFRTNYPSRPFYLLQPARLGSTNNDGIEDLRIPVGVSTTTPIGSAPNYGLLYSEVNRDSGSVSSVSDWFGICGLGTYPANTLVSLFIDTSGSMTFNTVKASYDKFLADCRTNNIIVAGNSKNRGERWAVDHNKTFSELIDLITITRTLNQNVPFYSDGVFLEALQNSLLDKKIGNDLQRFPNLYGYIGQKGRNSSVGTITITNADGTLSVNNSFMRGESTGNVTKTNWVNKYYSNINDAHVINVCDVTKNTPNGGRLTASDNKGINSTDVHGNMFSIFTTPNLIKTKQPGFFGTVFSSRTRRECYTLVITNSPEQVDGPEEMIDNGDGVGIDPKTLFSGLSAVRYAGYFDDDVNYHLSGQIDTQINQDYPNPMVVNNLDQFFKYTGNTSFHNNKTWIISGFFSPPKSGEYQFRLTSDDASYLWINQTDNFTTDNAIINNGGLHTVTTKSSGNIELNQGVLYPIRIIYGNQNLPVGVVNPTELTLGWREKGDDYTTDGSNYYYSSGELKTKSLLTEISERRYRIICLSSYDSTDGYDGVLFYGSAYEQPYAYITFTGTNTNDYTITKSSTVPKWTKKTNQKQNTLSIAQQTQGGLFKISNVYGANDYRKPFAEVISQFMEDTLN